MTVERAREMERQMTETAAGEGLDFRFDIQRSGTTFDAHRLVHLAAEHGLQDAMKERLLRAYFTEGELMSDPETLIRLAGEVGLDPDEARQMLASDRYAEEVRDGRAHGAQFGISAVPTFVVDRTIGASGAHPPEALLQLLNEGWARRARRAGHRRRRSLRRRRLLAPAHSGTSATVTSLTGCPEVTAVPSVDVGATGAVPTRIPSNSARSIFKPSSRQADPPGPTICTPLPFGEVLALMTVPQPFSVSCLSSTTPPS